MRVDAPDTSCFGARSDDFDGTSLDKDPLDAWSGRTRLYSVSGGALRLPTGVGDLYGARNDATNLVLQPAPDRRLAGHHQGHLAGDGRTTSRPA